MVKKYVLGLMMFAAICAMIIASLLVANSTAIASSAQQNDFESLIDFETIPGEVSVSGLAICDQFRETHGVLFRLEEGGCPVLADVGGEATAFLGVPNDRGPDMPVAGQNIGAFFLTDDGRFTDLQAATLIVDYITPTAQTSGVILDLDHGEIFTIEARNADGVVIATKVLTAGEPQTGDGIATPWQFQRTTNDIASLRFQGSREESGGFGLGFDLFHARSIPPIKLYLPIIQK